MEDNSNNKLIKNDPEKSPKQDKHNQENNQEKNGQAQENVNQNRQKFSKLEIIPYLIYYVIFLIIVFQQLNIQKAQQINTNIKNYFFQELADREYLDITYTDLVTWIQNTMLNKFYEQNPDTSIFQIPLDFQQLSGLRITTRRAAIDPVSNNLNNPIQEDFSDYGKNYQFHYQDKNKGYSQFFHTKNQTYQQAKEQLQYLFDEDYIDVSNLQLQIDSIFYVANFDMICFFIGVFEFPPEGLVLQNIQMRSLRIYPYTTTQDKFRFILEIIFLGFLIIYSFLEFIKLYNQYSRVQKKFEEEYQKQKKIKEAVKEIKIAQKQQQMLDSDGNIMSQSSFKDSGMMSSNNRQSMKYKMSSLNTNTQNNNLATKTTSNKLKIDAKEESFLLYMRFKNMGKGLLNHVSNIWSFLDLLNIFFNIFAVILWIELVDKDNNSAIKLILEADYSKITQYKYGLDQKSYLQVENDFHKLFSLNNQLGQLGNTLQSYQFFLSLSVFIMSFKVIKYMISLNSKAQTYLQVIMQVMNYMIFYLILLMTILFAFASFGNYYYGNRLYEFSTFYQTMVSLIGWLLGADHILDKMLEKNEIGTFIFLLMFYIILTSIMLNMFWVFTKNALQKFQEQRKLLNDIQQQQKKQSDTHFFYTLLDKLKSLFKLTKEEKMKKHMRNKQLLHDFNQHHDISYDISFEEELEKGEHNYNKYQSQDDKAKQNQILKTVIVKIIYSSAMLILLIFCNTILSQEFFKPERQYEMNKLMHNTIMDKEVDVFGSETTFGKTSNHVEIIQYFHQAFHKIFQNKTLDLSQLKKQQLSGKTLLDLKKQSQNEGIQNTKDFKIVGNTLDFFNILAFDKVRLSIRRVNIVDNDSPLNNVQAEIIESLFGPYAKPGYFGEFTDDIKVEGLDLKTGKPNQKRVYKYQKSAGFGRNGGYIKHLNPKDMQIEVEQMYLDKVFDNGVNCVVADFVLVNFVDSMSYTYVSVEAEFGPMGYVTIRNIHTKTFYIPQFMSSEGLLFIITLFILVTASIYNGISVFYKLYSKYVSYNNWYRVYVKNFLSEGQLYFRQRKEPELLRKFKYVISLESFLSIIFVVFLGLEMAFLIIEFYFIMVKLEYRMEIFGVPIVELFHEEYQYSKKVFTYQKQDFEEMMNQAQEIQQYSNQILQPIFSVTVYVMCIELLYNLTYYKDFYNIFKALQKIFVDIIYLVLILTLFLMAFAFLTHYYIGTKYIMFSTIFKSFVTLTEFLYSIQLKGLEASGPNSEFQVFVVLVPYMICVRFLMLTLFYATSYIGYNELKQDLDKKQNMEENTISIGFKEFFVLSKQFFLKEDHKFRNIQFMKQQIEKINDRVLFGRIKDTIRKYKANMPIHVWADMCAQDIKYEQDVRQGLKSICDDIVVYYLKQTNMGKRNFLEELNKDEERKVQEYLVRLKLFDYYRKFSLFSEKVNKFFEIKSEIFRKKIKNKHEPGNKKEEEEYYMSHYIDNMEKQLEDNMVYLKNLKHQVQILEDFKQSQQLQKNNDKKRHSTYNEQQKILYDVAQQGSQQQFDKKIQ